ncbi:hypothetical protein EDD36DRAFT_122319 [Exophiala viscosa]|uniref:Carboxylic ester hydrolase n=1 Tax=Exophiala viscosa TaxID=2486360 RepID=A0AAN6E3P8_9EURO|nr:hypothetical protein EDD36DRAFT_122319 [Exophiala viscosa]
MHTPMKSPLWCVSILLLFCWDATALLVQKPTGSGNDSSSPTTASSVHICQNFDWGKPCIDVGVQTSGSIGQNLFWMAPAPLGEGPFRTFNYTIGSWGPSAGLFTFWEDHQGNTSTILTYPGSGRVDSYWGPNIWTFTAWAVNSERDA